MTPEDHERLAAVLGEDSLRAWADALSREWPVSSAEIVEMHSKLDLVGMKSWRIPWLIQDLLRGKRICFMSTELQLIDAFDKWRALGLRSSGKSTTIAAQRRRDQWLDDVLSPTRDEPIKLRRRTIDVPEVAVLLLPKQPRRLVIDYASFSELVRGPKNSMDVARSIAAIASLQKQGII